MATAPALHIPRWTFADRLRKAREDAGYRQAELAERIGISTRSVGKYESGAADPRRPTILSWAIATGVPVEWLTEGQDTTDDLGFKALDRYLLSLQAA